MDAAAIELRTGANDDARPSEQRGAPRFYALIRSAKLISRQGEFVCVVRDVSTTGVRLRCFHSLPRESTMALELQNGDVFEIERVREDGADSSFRFAQPVTIDRLIQQGAPYPQRPLRLNLAFPLSLRTLAGPVAAVTQNVSQQGCRVEAALPLAISQAVVLESPHMPGIRAKVRWRRDGHCGLVFDDIFSLRDFAIHAAQLQCPALTAA